MGKGTGDTDHPSKISNNRLDKKELIIKLNLLKVALFLFSTNICLLSAHEKYSSIKVWSPDLEKIQIIQEIGIPLDHSTFKPGSYIEFVVTEKERETLQYRGVSFDIIIDNLTKFYQEQNIPAIERDFPLGSMQGNYTWSELNERFDQLRNLYPDIISDRLVIGQSLEGNDIWAFKLSDNPDQDEDEPQVLYTGLTHAREPLSMMNLFYFVQKVL